ncbi:hypothetical protein B0T14DRAFT_592316 [Immersiella caudata]|uniref:HNH nuclease domain-containing protein n=1 Tax=Immersiella caudata TaxID=314043 RepID=A0AA39WEU4_9PEZI|nr:hypothetical protein B0T14DRAFT_592316 [Immersiella caudata]
MAAPPHGISSTLPPLPVDDMELRIEYINRLEQHWRANFEYLAKQDVSRYRRFYDVQFAALYLMDLQQLQTLATGQHLSLMVDYFLQQLECLPALDDHRCILTKQRFPEARHIVSHAFNNAERSRASLDKLLPQVLPFFFLENLMQLSSDVRHVFSSSVGASDRKWNMISLNPTMHDWWRRGCFGLKWLGPAASASTEPNHIQTIRLQFQ